MTLIGLTGGPGMGKSTAAQLMRKHGVAVVDTDDIARQVVAKGEPGLDEVTSALGSDLLDSSGDLRRELLAAKVFDNAQARRTLESILHPRIRAQWLAVVNGWKGEGRSVGVVVIPLLFETEAAGEFDEVLCVACPKEAQATRLAARGWSLDQAAQRISAQWPIEKKMDLADHVAWNAWTPEILEQQLKRIPPLRPQP